MQDRLQSSLLLLHPGSCYIIAIDDFEMSKLNEIVDQLFSGFEKYMVVVNHHPQGGMSRNISKTHEYMIMLVPKEADILRGKSKISEKEYRSFALSGPGENKSRSGRPNSFYSILIDRKSNKIMGLEPPPLDQNYPREETKEGFERVYPINQDGEEKVWCRTYNTAVQMLKKEEIALSKSGTIKLVVDNTGKRHSMMSNWTDSRYNSGPHGTGLVSEIIGNREAFSYPKSIHTVTDAIEGATYRYASPIILDYFAGSGTTSHAVINLNREDGGRRKYILVEMGEYFDSVLKQRLAKVIYSPTWRDGKPVVRDQGSSHCFKYVRLESYEDAMANLELVQDGAQQELLAKDPQLQESYLLRYMLDMETRASLLKMSAFRHPWRYILRVQEANGVMRERHADLVETLNYLLGLRVDRYRSFGEDDLLFVSGYDAEQRRVLVVWRDVDTWPADRLKARLSDALERLAGEHSFARVYVNVDCPQLREVRRARDESWTLHLVEEVFHRRMFSPLAS